MIENVEEHRVSNINMFDDDEESSDQFVEWNVSMPNNHDLNESDRRLTDQ